MAAMMSTVVTMAASANVAMPASANVAVAKAKGQQLPSRGHQWHPGIPRGAGTERTERPWTSTARRRRAGRLASGNMAVCARVGWDGGRGGGGGG